MTAIHSAAAPCGSIAVWSAHGVRSSSVTSTSAAARAAFTSPRCVTRGWPFGTLPDGRTGGAPGACREFQTEIVIDGRREPAHGTACRQPDGTSVRVSVKSGEQLLIPAKAR